jgi:hypothetical protein
LVFARLPKISGDWNGRAWRSAAHHRGSPQSSERPQGIGRGDLQSSEVH